VLEEVLEEVIVIKVRKDNESDTEDDNVIYKVSSNGKIMWNNN
jgi:hypothetical protein